MEAYFRAIETSLFVGKADANFSTFKIEGNAANIAQEIVRRVSETVSVSG